MVEMTPQDNVLYDINKRDNNETCKDCIHCNDKRTFTTISPFSGKDLTYHKCSHAPERLERCAVYAIRPLDCENFQRLIKASDEPSAVTLKEVVDRFDDIPACDILKICLQCSHFHGLKRDCIERFTWEDEEPRFFIYCDKHIYETYKCEMIRPSLVKIPPNKTE
jgi:hypothetical protein